MSVFIKKNNVLSPEVGPLICDKLSITVDIPKQNQKQVAHNVRDLGPTMHRGNYKFAGMLPANCLGVPPSADKTHETSVLVQCQPRSHIKNARYMRFEFNPSTVDLQWMVAQVDLIHPGLYKRAFKEGSVTRSDFAVDIAHAEMKDLLFCAPNFSIAGMRSTSGRTEYIGSSAWRIYDKRKQIKSNNQKKIKSLQVPVPESPLIRIERILKFPRTFPELIHLPNPFQKLTVAAYSHLESEGNLWRLFLRLAQYEGAQTALLRIPDKPIRARFRKKLALGQVDWFKPDLIWNQLPGLVTDIIDPYQMTGKSAA